MIPASEFELALTIIMKRIDASPIKLQS